MRNDDMGDNTPSAQIRKYAVRDFWVDNPNDPKQIEQAIQNMLASFFVPYRLVSIYLAEKTPKIAGISRTGGHFIAIIEAWDSIS